MFGKMLLLKSVTQTQTRSLDLCLNAGTLTTASRRFATARFHIVESKLKTAVRTTLLIRTRKVKRSQFSREEPNPPQYVRQDVREHVTHHRLMSDFDDLASSWITHSKHTLHTSIVPTRRSCLVATDAAFQATLQFKSHFFRHPIHSVDLP